MRCSQTLLSITFIYLIVVLIGLIPVNNNFKASPNGTEIHFVSSSVHADIILPINTTTIDWHQEFSSNNFGRDLTSARWIAFGWGDRGFFTETPTWADFKLSTAVKALFLPSEACLHVYGMENQSLPSDAKSVKISTPQYERLVKYIQDSFRRDQDGNAIIISHDGATI